MGVSSDDQDVAKQKNRAHAEEMIGVLVQGGAVGAAAASEGKRTRQRSVSRVPSVTILTEVAVGKRSLTAALGVDAREGTVGEKNPRRD